MSLLTTVMLIFSVLGAIDRIIGNKFGLGAEFEKGFNLLGTMALSMIGMIVVSPLIAEAIKPFLEFCTNTLHIDPSVIPASLFANDMGGAPLCAEVSKNADVGMYNALIVSSMMGCTISFTIPVALTMVTKEKHKEMLFGMLCGLVTIPIGCFVSGLICKLPFALLSINILPLVIICFLIGFALIKFPKQCITVFKYFGLFIKILITVGLVMGIINFLCGEEVIKGISTFEEGAFVCFNASAVMSGAFPLIFVVSKILTKPLKALGDKIGINEISAMGFISTIATSVTTFASMENMDKKGVVLNSAFAVSAAFTFAGHLAFTVAFDSSYVLPMIVGKLVAGAAALILSNFLFKRVYK